MTGKTTSFYLGTGILLTLLLLAPPAAALITEYLNTNLPGNDYSTIDMPAKEGCAIACLNDNQCLAATWVQRVGQTPTCSLKNAVPAKTAVAGENILAIHSYIKNDAVVTPRSTQPCDTGKAAFVADTSSGPAPLTVHFTDTTTGVSQAVWDWGDGTREYAAVGSDMDHTFTKPGSYTVNLTVSDASGTSCATRTILVTGTQAAGYNNLWVDTVPGGARLSIDGNTVGTTPVRLGVNLASGVHHIRLSLEGYDEYTDDVTLSPGQTFDLKVMLTKSSSGGTPSYTYQPAATGSAPARTTAGTDLKQALRDSGLTPAGSGVPAPGTGILIISSNPAGAGVYLDGRSAGNTPLTVPDVPAGQHTLLLTLQGYTEASRAVNISAGSENQVAVEMSAAKKTPGFAAMAGLLSVALLVLFRKRTG